MKYADESSFGHSISVARWKPMTPEAFVLALHTCCVQSCDDNGNDGIWNTKSVKVDKHQTVTVYYVPKRHPSASRDERPSIGRPVLLTLTAPGGKIVCMEYVPPVDEAQSQIIGHVESAIVGPVIQAGNIRISNDVATAGMRADR